MGVVGSIRLADSGFGRSGIKPQRPASGAPFESPDTRGSEKVVSKIPIRRLSCRFAERAGQLSFGVDDQPRLRSPSTFGLCAFKWHGPHVDRNPQEKTTKPWEPKHRSTPKPSIRYTYINQTACGCIRGTQQRERLTL